MSDRRPSPQLGGATETLVHERASATPSSQGHHPRHDHGRRDEAHSAPALPQSTSLRALQNWFVEAVTSPCADDRLAAGARQALTRGPALDELERLAIYRHAYRARLVECLVDDYPALEFALGGEAFEALCHEYLLAHPSTSPNLSFFDGAGWRASARHEAKEPFPHRHFAADLAMLEWALVEVIHARVSDALSPDELAKIPVEQWSAARLPPSAAVRVLRFDYPVNAFFQAFKTDAQPVIPDPSPSATVVYRTEMTLWRMDLTPAMATLLEGLFRGETLGEALGKLENGLLEDEAAEAERNVMLWFREWVQGGPPSRASSRVPERARYGRGLRLAPSQARNGRALRRTRCFIRSSARRK